MKHSILYLLLLFSTPLFSMNTPENAVASAKDQVEFNTSFQMAYDYVKDNNELRETLEELATSYLDLYENPTENTIGN